MENRMRAKEDYKPYTANYSLIDAKETYGPPTS